MLDSSNNFIYEIELFLKKFGQLFSAPILTILVLIFILLRAQISNLIILIISKMLKVDNYKVKTKNRHLKTFLMSIGIYCFFLIWSKDLILINRIKKIVIIIGIFTIARITVCFTDPEIMSSEMKYLDINEKNFLLKKFLLNIFKIVLYIVAIFASLTVLGVNINGLMTGLGIGSAIIALAVQDVFKNLIAGSTIIAEKPFLIGDFVELEGLNIKGTVEDISLRSSSIRRLDNSLINIPNYLISSTPVRNYTAINNRRVEFNLNLPVYLSSDDINRITNKIKMVFSNDSKILQQTIVVTLNKINQDGFNLFVYCYINESRYVKTLEQQEKMLCDIIDILKSENIEFQNKNINLYYAKQKTREDRAILIEENDSKEFLDEQKKDKNKKNIRNI